MLEDNILERDERVREDIESPRSIPASHDTSVEPDGQDATARAPSSEEAPDSNRSALRRSSSSP